MYTVGHVSCSLYVNKFWWWQSRRNVLAYNCYKHSQHRYHAQRCATTKVTFELKLQIHENWCLGYPNAPKNEFAGLSRMTVYKTLQFSSVLYDINGNYAGLKNK